MSPQHPEPEHTITIALTAEVAEQLQHAAEWVGIDIEQATQQAMRDYVRRFSRSKLDQESRAFDKLRPELLSRYRGQYVAVHQATVVAHAPSLALLRDQVVARFGHAPILYKLVTDAPDEDIRTHGLRITPDAS